MALYFIGTKFMATPVGPGVGGYLPPANSPVTSPVGLGVVPPNAPNATDLALINAGGKVISDITKGLFDWMKGESA